MPRKLYYYIETEISKKTDPTYIPLKKVKTQKVLSVSGLKTIFVHPRLIKQEMQEMDITKHYLLTVWRSNSAISSSYSI